MKIYRRIKEISRPKESSVITVGIFDGVHRGHAYIIKKLVKNAKKTKRKSAVVTFHPHPFSSLYPKKIIPLLSSLDHRLRLFEKLDVDIALVVGFNKTISLMSPENFVKNILVKKLGMKEMLVGEDFVFGKKRGGDIKLLKKLSKKYNFKVKKIKLLKKKRKKISSTYIRSLILKGRIKESSALLARPVSILGTVKGGTRTGRVLGFPTANVDPHHEAIPPSGVYAVYAKLEGRKYCGILNIGFRPTFHPMHYAPEPSIEVHILDFNKIIYNKDIEIIFVKRLRPEKKFNDMGTLKKRIAKDILRARKILGQP